MSQCTQPCTSGASAEKYARASACVLYIFQFPAITGRRIAPLLRCFFSVPSVFSVLKGFRVYRSALPHPAIFCRPKIRATRPRRSRCGKLCRQVRPRESRRRNLRRQRWTWRPWQSPPRPRARFPACPWRTPASRTRPSGRSTQLFSRAQAPRNISRWYPVRCRVPSSRRAWQ